MVSLPNLTIVFIAGLITALATGLGALPILYFSDITDRVYVVLWGIASGIMGAASIFGLYVEAFASGTLIQIGVGTAAGILLVVFGDYVLNDTGSASDYVDADLRQLLLILGVLTVHSFPEGVAIGVSFAALDLHSGVSLLWFTVPQLAILMTVAISIHNIPEGLAISVPLRSMDVSGGKTVWWAVFSSLPQPIGAVFAYVFVQSVESLVPVGFAFAGSAMLYLIGTEFVPEAREYSEGLESSGVWEFGAGMTGGVLVMLPLFVL